MTTTKHSKAFLLAASVVTIIFSVTSAALAVEGGLARPISGMQIVPFSGGITPAHGTICMPEIGRARTTSTASAELVTEKIIVTTDAANRNALLCFVVVIGVHLIVAVSY